MKGQTDIIRLLNELDDTAEKNPEITEQYTIEGMLAAVMLEFFRIKKPTSEKILLEMIADAVRQREIYIRVVAEDSRNKESRNKSIESRYEGD